MVLNIGESAQVKAYVDSSFGLYEDGQSVIMLGNATIYVKSRKQKILTRSSTEAELVDISDALSQILWTREYLSCFCLVMEPATVYQDNLSTIFLANKGRSASERNRHIIRHFFITHYIENKQVILMHMPTADMIADLLTKPLHGAMFAKLASLITGNI